MTTFVKPMLAHPWTGGLAWPTEGWIAEPKLDGQRALVHVEGHKTVALYSRLGNDGLDHTGLEWLRAMRWKTPAMILDAELFAGGGNGAAPEVRRIESVLPRRLAVFDVLSVENSYVVDLVWSERRKLLEKVLKGQKHPSVTVTVTSVEIGRLWSEWTKVGGEGVMLKRTAARYQIGRRSADWLKAKVTFPVDVVVTGVTDRPTYGAKQYAGGMWALEYGFYEPDQGKVVQSGQGLMRGKKAELEKHIGRVAEVKTYACMDTGGLRHAQFLRWRADKRAEECVRP